MWVFRILQLNSFKTTASNLNNFSTALTFLTREIPDNEHNRPDDIRQKRQLLLFKRAAYSHGGNELHYSCSVKYLKVCRDIQWRSQSSGYMGATSTVLGRKTQIGSTFTYYPSLPSCFVPPPNFSTVFAQMPPPFPATP